MRDDYYQKLIDQQQRDRFLLPAYGHTSIAEIMPTVINLLGGNSQRPQLPNNYIDRRSYNNVLLMIVDGLGWDLYPKLAKHSSFFAKLIEQRQVFPLTSVFPSTTPAALTTLHTGFTPQEHGLLEWYTYFEEFQKVIMPMQFRSSWHEDINSLQKIGGNFKHLYENRTAYQILKECQIDSYILTPLKYVPSVYNDAVMYGAEIITYENLSSMLQSVQKLLRTKESSFISAYWGQIDSAGHQYGPGSSKQDQEIADFAQAIDEYFNVGEQRNDSNLMLLTADHGQISINPENFIYLEDHFDFVEYLYHNQDDEIILPFGSPNDVFLLTQFNKTQSLIRILKRALKGKAEVYNTKELLDKGYFGLFDPTERFIKRLGTVCIIPYPGHHVWFEYSNKREYNLKGLHGGLSRQEMLVPLVVVTIN